MHRNTLWVLLLLTALSFKQQVWGQKKGFVITFGSPYGFFLSNDPNNLASRPGIQMGLDFWTKNRKGHDWSASVNYQIVRREGDVLFNGRKEERKEKYDYVQLRFAPLIWWLDTKKRFFAEAGIFMHYLAQQETQVGSIFLDLRPNIKSFYGGPCGGLGYKLGKEGDRNSLYFGIRDEYGALAFGSGSSDVRFNTLSVYVGLGF